MHKENMHLAMETLSSWLVAECGKGQDCFDICAAGQVADMLKDLSEASKELEEKSYYESVTKAMDEYGKEDRAGYDHWRYPSSGRYASSGHGEYSADGYNPMHGNVRFFSPMDDRMGINDGKPNYPMGHEGSSRYGYRYDEYMDAKRHYTEAKDDKSKQHMNQKIEETVLDSIDIMRNVMMDATPELRKKMKEHMMKLAEEIGKM